MAEDSKEKTMPIENPPFAAQTPAPQGKTFMERVESFLQRLKPGTTSAAEQLIEAHQKMHRQVVSKTAQSAPQNEKSS